MKIYPLWLRERLIYRIDNFLKLERPYLNVPLEFAPSCLIDLNPLDTGHMHLRRNYFYERVLSKKIFDLSKKGGLLLDVGANYGYFSIIWANQQSKNRVIAFEASPLNWQNLSNNIHKNNLDNQVIIESCALGAEQGKMDFYLGDEDGQTGWGGLSINNNDNTVEVEIDTIDKYCDRNNIEQIDVLKIDVEGADTWVLFGCKHMLLSKKIHHIFFEQNIERMRKLHIEPSAPISFLKNMGYVVKEMSPNEFYAYL